MGRVGELAAVDALFEELIGLGPAELGTQE